MIRIPVALLIIFQFLDGLFTYTGVQIYGTIIEGNPIIKHLMDSIGAGYGLMLMKGLCIAILIRVYIRYSSAKHGLVIALLWWSVASIYAFVVSQWFFVLYMM